MRHTVNNAEVYHLFANQRMDNWNDHARNSGDSCSFSGRSAFSYRATIAKYVDIPKHDKKAEKERKQVVLVDCDYASGYSNTTGRHVSNLYSAFRGHDIKIFTVPFIEFRLIEEVKGPENVHEEDIEHHLLNMTYLRQKIVAECRDRGHWYSSDDVENWLNYVHTFKLRRLLNDVDKKIYDYWISNGMSKHINSDIADSIKGPFKMDNLTRAEQRAIAELAEVKADDLKDVFWSYWGLGKKPANLGRNNVTPDQFNAKLIEIKTRWALAEERDFKAKLRSVLHNENSAKYREMSFADRIAAWKESGNRDYLDFRTYPSKVGGWPIQDGFNLPHRVFFRSRYGYSAEFRVCRLTDKKVITSGGVEISQREFAMYWKRYIRPLWNVRFNEKMFTQLFRFMRFNKEHRVSRAYSIDDMDMSYGLFKIGCHVLVFDDIADIAHRLGLEPTVLKWKPTCLNAPSIPAREAVQ